MTEEEIKALQEAKEQAERIAAEAKAAAEAAKAEAEKAKGDVDKVVNELKELRQKRTVDTSSADITNPTDINALLEQKLAEKEAERRKAEFEEAISEFKSSKTEFQSDAAGIVYGKFQEALKKFNFSDVTNKTQAKQRLEEVYRFVNGASPEGGGSSYDGSPRIDGQAPTREGGPSKEVEQAMNMAKINTEKFSKLKSKYGEAMSGLGIE